MDGNRFGLGRGWPLSQFQSDQYLYLAPDEIVLSFKDSAAMEALYMFADLTDDDDLVVAIRKRLDVIADEYVQPWGRLKEEGF